MITNNKISLILLCSAVPLLGSQEPHITESEVCKKFMKDYSRNSWADKTWLDKKRNESAASEQKYRALKDDQKLKNLNELKRCITFLEKFPNYQASIGHTSRVFEEIDPRLIPDAAVIDKVNDASKRKEVTQEEAWKLFESKPCQNIYPFCLDEKGILSEERVKNLKREAFSLINHKRTEAIHVSSDPLNSTKEVPLTPEKMLPEHISQKAAILYACLTIIEQKIEAQKLVNGGESYLEESKKI